MDSNKKLALSLASVAVGMVMIAFAAGPIYNIFCKVTGYGGTTQVAKKYSKYKGKRKIIVRFDSNVDSNLPWRFQPEQKQMEVRPGENALAFYSAENISDEDIIGTSVYNVTPDRAGIYFNKIHCFCFEEQLLKSKQKIMMPVSFFLDPDLENDRNLDDVDTITLSYRFFKVKSVNKK